MEDDGVAAAAKGLQQSKTPRRRARNLERRNMRVKGRGREQGRFISLRETLREISSFSWYAVFPHKHVPIGDRKAEEEMVLGILNHSDMIPANPADHT